MEMHAGARPAAERHLFDFLAATRPERPDRGSAAAVGAAVTVHAAVLSLAVWGTVAASPAANREPERAGEYAVNLLPPAVLVDEHGTAPSSSRHAARRRAPGSDVLAARWLLAMAPPTISVEPIVPMPVVFASLARSEYAGLGGDSSYSAAQIVDDHHDASADELAAEPPRFTAFTQPPELSNPDDVKKRLSREYPPFLQDAGIGGRVVLWFLVDETGQVRKWMMKQSSGHPALDRAAMRVAGLMRFRPARNYYRPVAVWVALPVFFRVLEEAG